MHSFHLGYFFSYTHTYKCTHSSMHTHALHAYIRERVTAIRLPNVSKNHPNPLFCCLTLLSPCICSFLLLFYAIQNTLTCRASNLSVQILPSRAAVICRRKAGHYRNKPYIGEKRMMSTFRNYLNYFDSANG